MSFVLKDTLTGQYYANPHEQKTVLAGEGEVPRTYETPTGLKGCITKAYRYWGEMLPLIKEDPQGWADTWGSARRDCGPGERQVQHILDREHLLVYGLEIVEVEVTVVHTVTITEI